MKILVSYGFGAGWSTWASDDKVARYMLTYQPIIEFLERGGSFDHDDSHGKKLDSGPSHPLLIQLQKDCMKKFGVDHVCVIGADDLVVENVSGLFRIKEYDGRERVEYADNGGWELAK